MHKFSVIIKTTHITTISGCMCEKTEEAWSSFIYACEQHLSMVLQKQTKLSENETENLHTVEWAVKKYIPSVTVVYAFQEEISMIPEHA